MTAATLFTPQITPEIDDMSADTGLDNHAWDTDGDSMEYEDVADDHINEDSIAAAPSTSTESAEFLPSPAAPASASTEPGSEAFRGASSSKRLSPREVDSLTELTALPCWLRRAR